MHEGLARKALRVHALNDVAGDDIVDDLLDVGEVPFALDVGANRAGMPDRFGRVGRRYRRTGFKPLDQLVDSELGCSISSVNITIKSRMGHDLDHVLEMVEQEHGVDELEQRLGQTVMVAFGGLYARLEVSNRLVPEISDRAAVEWRQVRVGHKIESAQFRLNFVERINRASRGRAEDSIGLGSDEGNRPGRSPPSTDSSRNE